MLPSRMLLEEILKSGKVYSLSRSRIRWGFHGRNGNPSPTPLSKFTLQIIMGRLLRTRRYSVPGHVRRFPHASCDQVEYMCNADVTLLTWDWVQGHNIPYPNFNTRHQCRNYKKLSDWSIEHAMHIPRPEVTCFEDTVDMHFPIHLMRRD